MGITNGNSYLTLTYGLRIHFCAVGRHNDSFISMFTVYFFLQMDDSLQFRTTLVQIDQTPIVISTSAVYCPLPDNTTYVVAVTYDQTTFTDPVNVLVYDACCYTCDGNTLLCSIAVSILTLKMWWSHRQGWIFTPFWFGIGIPIINLRRSWDRLMFIMGFLYL